MLNLKLLLRGIAIGPNQIDISPYHNTTKIKIFFPINGTTLPPPFLPSVLSFLFLSLPSLLHAALSCAWYFFFIFFNITKSWFYCTNCTMIPFFFILWQPQDLVVLQNLFQNGIVIPLCTFLLTLAYTMKSCIFFGNPIT